MRKEGCWGRAEEDCEDCEDCAAGRGAGSDKVSSDMTFKEETEINRNGGPRVSERKL